jgi:hypothetical protein
MQDPDMVGNDVFEAMSSGKEGDKMTASSLVVVAAVFDVSKLRWFIVLDLTPGKEAAVEEEAAAAAPFPPPLSCCGGCSCACGSAADDSEVSVGLGKSALRDANLVPPVFAGSIKGREKTVVVASPSPPSSLWSCCGRFGAVSVPSARARLAPVHGCSGGGTRSRVRERLLSLVESAAKLLLFLLLEGITKHKGELQN